MASSPATFEDVMNALEDLATKVHAMNRSYVSMYRQMDKFIGDTPTMVTCDDLPNGVADVTSDVVVPDNDVALVVPNNIVPNDDTNNSNNAEDDKGDGTLDEIAAFARPHDVPIVWHSMTDSRPPSGPLSVRQVQPSYMSATSSNSRVPQVKTNYFLNNQGRNGGLQNDAADGRTIPPLLRV